MKRRRWGVVLGALLLAALARHYSARVAPAGPFAEAGRPPRIRPDYTGVTIPPNIAPLNFVIHEPGRRYSVRLSGAGQQVDVAAADGVVRIPPRAWRRVLQAGEGREILCDVYAEDEQGRWTHFDTIRNRVAAEPVDPYLVYRRIGPVFNGWVDLQIRERSLETGEERCVLDNRLTRTTCMNCHTFAQNRPDLFLFHTRPPTGSKVGAGMVVVRDGKATRTDTKAAGAASAGAYSSWHPSGRLVAFSTNKIRQFFHTSGQEPRDVVDLKSGIGIYSFDTGKVTAPASVDRPDRLETFPAWSEDGRYLYFSSAPAPWGPNAGVLRAVGVRVRYDLVRVAFDAATGVCGPPETVLSARAADSSILEPRISPDGRFALVTLCDYGSFPIHQMRSDLALIDLRAKGFPWRRVEEGPASPRDSWHGWSSNGRWIICSRKQEYRTFARPYLRYIDAEGKAGKAFVMPQSDPTFYDRCTDTYNVPELVMGPIRASQAEMARAARGE